MRVKGPLHLAVFVSFAVGGEVEEGRMREAEGRAAAHVGCVTGGRTSSAARLLHFLHLYRV